MSFPEIGLSQNPWNWNYWWNIGWVFQDWPKILKQFSLTETVLCFVFIKLQKSVVKSPSRFNRVRLFSFSSPSDFQVSKSSTFQSFLCFFSSSVSSILQLAFKSSESEVQIQSSFTDWHLSAFHQRHWRYLNTCQSDLDESVRQKSAERWM